KRIPLAEAGSDGDGRRVHAPRLLAAAQDRRSQGRDGRRLGGRLLLPVPRRACAGQPQGAALHVRERHHAGDRRRPRKEGSVGMASRLQALWGWFDARMPSVAEQWKIHASEYYAPKNFNFWYFF